jgi:hypothetical protein
MRKPIPICFRPGVWSVCGAISIVFFLLMIQILFCLCQAFGSLGIMTELTFQCTPVFTMRKHALYIPNFAAVANTAAVRAVPRVVLWYFWHSGGGHAMVMADERSQLGGPVAESLVWRSPWKRWLEETLVRLFRWLLHVSCAV